MLIFIYGDDLFRAKQKVDQMRLAFAEKFDPTGINLSVFPGGAKKLECGPVLEAVRSAPFLSEKRMVIIRELISGSTKSDESQWVEGLSHIPDSTIVIVWEHMSSKQLERRTLFKKLADVSERHAYTFPKLSEAETVSWIVDRATVHQGAIERRAAAELIKQTNADLWTVDIELKKLIDYAHPRAVSVEDVQTLVQASPEGRVFELMDAMTSGQTKRVLQLLEQERLAGSNDHYLLTMLGRQIRLLLGASAQINQDGSMTKSELAAMMNIHPFVANKLLTQAKKVDPKKMLSIHDTLFRLDLESKQGLVSPSVAIDLLVMNISSEVVR